MGIESTVLRFPLGTGALSARQIPTFPDKMYADAEGTIVSPDGVMLITKIKVTMHITIPADKRPEADRALAVFERNCPVHQTLKNCVAITIDSVVTEV